MCSGCNERVHALCSHRAKCFKCVCRICDSPPGDVICPCKVCKHRVHAGCAVPVPYRIEVVCKHCIPKSPVKVPPAKKKFKRRFKPAWQVGRPWLMHANGVMWCLACRAYPRPGMQKARVTGTCTLRHTAVLEHSNTSAPPGKFSNSAIRFTMRYTSRNKPKMVLRTCSGSPPMTVLDVSPLSQRARATAWRPELLC